MILRWQQGRERIEEMLNQRLLERVSADRALAEAMLAVANKHLAAAKHTLEVDSVGSFQLAYDGARKALSALLQTQGLRATSKGGHRAVEDALRAQLVPPMEKQMNSFGWMRKLRNDSEYPNADRDVADHQAAISAHTTCAEIIVMVKQLINEMPVY